MAEYLIQDTTLNEIADAINTKTGGSSAMTPAQMVTAIGNIQTGGLGDFELADTIEVSEPVSQLSITVPAWAKELYITFQTVDSASNKPSLYHTYVAASRLLCGLNTTQNHSGNFVVMWTDLDNNNLGKIVTACSFSSSIGKCLNYGKPNSILYNAPSGTTFTGTFNVYGRR